MPGTDTVAAEIDAAIQGADEDACVALLSALTEAERRALAPAIITRYQQLEELAFDFKARSETRSASFGQLQCAYLALYGTASFTEIKKAGHRSFKGDRLYDLLAARRPAWLETWISWTLEANGINWKTVRRMVREGVCRRPEPDTNYCLWMILQRAGVRPTLEGDPELLEYELWRLFEIEGRPDISLAQNDKYSNPAHNWAQTLVALAEEGRIDRSRLLAASLSALQRGFPQFQAGWFSRFHEALLPNIEERATLTREYLHLLSSPIPPTVSFALSALTRLEKAHRLDAAAFLEAVPPALYTSEKKSASMALKLLAGMAGREPGLRDRAAEMACTFLEHPAVEIQEKAIEFVKRHSAAPQLEERLSAAAAIVRPSLRARLPVEEPDRAAPPVESDPRLRSIPREWLRMAGVHPDGSLEALDPRQPGIPILHDGNATHPIETVEELVTVYLNVLETEGPPEEIERVLDGVARLCTRRPDGFDRLVSPLSKRAAQLIKRPWPRTPAPLLSGVALAWLTQAPWAISTDGKGAEAFLANRLKALAERVLAGASQQLMSAPTHAGGWISASVYRDRSGLADATDEFDRLLAELRCFGNTASVPRWLGVRLDEASSIRWAATLAPNHRDAWFRTGAAIIAQDLDWWMTHWAAKTYLEALFEHDTQLGKPGLYLIVFGMASKESGEATLATDALVAGIEDGRIEPTALGEALMEVANRQLAVQEPKQPAPRIKLPRLIKRLREASRVSKLHAATVHRAWSPLIGAVRAKPVRELFNDLVAECTGYDPAGEQLRVRLDRAERWAKTGHLPASI